MDQVEKSQKTDAVDQNPVLRITRNFNAPRDRVYRAFTEPGDLEKWFGPEGVDCTVHEIDPRPGGAYSFTMRNENGDVHPHVRRFSKK